MSVIEKRALALAALALAVIVVSFVASLPEPMPEPAPIVKQVRGVQGPSAVFADF